MVVSTEEISKKITKDMTRSRRHVHPKWETSTHSHIVTRTEYCYTMNN